MTAIMLTRFDDRRNMARFYKLYVQPTLFGECSLIREWGRIGRAGTVRVETYRSRGERRYRDGLELDAEAQERLSIGPERFWADLWAKQSGRGRRL
jgi:predicted DNA-binding WGR domain protein